MQARLRTIARVSQQRWEESHILESHEEHLQIIPQPTAFHLPFLAFHSEGGESESQTPR